jgi:hypothetical protein
MKRVTIGFSLACMALSVIVVGLRADDTDQEKALRSRLVGTWRIISMKVNGEKNDLPVTSVTYKHVTPVGFMWLSHEKDTGKVFRAAGGTYTLRGDTYTEKVEYGMGDDFDVIKNTQHPFMCKIEGDSWQHSGKLSNGTSIDEIWERVKTSEKDKTLNKR